MNCQGTHYAYTNALTGHTTHYGTLYNGFVVHRVVLHNEFGPRLAPGRDTIGALRDEGMV